MMSEAVKPDSDSLMALHALLKIRSDSVVDSEEPVASASRRKNKTSSVSPIKQHAMPQGQNLSHVTPPFGAMSPRSSLSPTFTLNYDLQQSNANLATAAPFSPVVSLGPAAEPMAVPSSTVSLQTVVAATTNPRAETLCTKGNRKVKETAAAAKPVVRTNEIEAALRSKPQRGRKRDNLSALERLELTRTRNREHAKSTR